jgi:hypothetical protein
MVVFHIAGQAPIEVLVSGDLDVLGAAWAVLSDPARRVAAMPELAEAARFGSRYFCRCILENPAGSEWAPARYIAAHEVSSLVSDLAAARASLTYCPADT